MHMVLFFVILVDIAMGLVVETIFDSNEVSFVQKFAITVFHAIDVIIIACYIYLYRSIKG